MTGIFGFAGIFNSILLEKAHQKILHYQNQSPIYWSQSDQVGLTIYNHQFEDPFLSKKYFLQDSSHNCIIIYTGYFDNEDDLKNLLAKKDITCNLESTAEILLNLYQLMGYQMLQHLRGAFTFAIFDQQEQTLFLATDGIGYKNLYYSCLPTGFLFASELKYLLLERSLSREIDQTALQQYLTFLSFPAPLTPFKAIQKLEPGHALLIHHRVIEKHWCFYDLPYKSQPLSFSISEAETLLHSKLERAVEKSISQSYAVGCLLSGGVDSSALAYFARQFISKQKFPCYTLKISTAMSADEDFSQDLIYARKTANFLDLKLHEIQTPNFFENLSSILNLFDEPVADPAIFNLYLLCQAAQKQGINRLLSGLGGDDLFAGYRRHYAIMQEKYWYWWPQWIRGILGLIAQNLHPTSITKRRFCKAFYYANLNQKQRLTHYFYWNDPQIIQNLFKVSSLPFNDPLQKLLKSLPDKLHPLNQMLYLEGKHFLANHNLHYLNQISIATGIKIQTPFLDHELINLATSLPINFKQRGKTGKWILKKMLANLLPQEILQREKLGLGWPLRTCLQKINPEIMQIYLSEKKLKSYNIFHEKNVQQLIQENQQSSSDHAYTIFALLCFMMWYEKI